CRHGQESDSQGNCAPRAAARGDAHGTRRDHEMNDEHLRDLLLRAQGSLPTVGFDPAEDLVRARRARTRQWVARTGVVATAAVVGVALALSIFPRAGDALGGLTPAGGGSATVASTAAASVETRAAEP